MRGRRTKGAGGRCTALLTLAFGGGCNPVEGFVERGIEAERPRVIGPADRYAVDITGLRTSTGEAERVTALGERVRPENAPAPGRTLYGLAQYHLPRLHCLARPLRRVRRV